jgi:DNA-directed RNA polymerase specialized sigma24 family protein
LGARKQAIHKILGRMKQKKRVVFAMSDMHGMSAPEISKILNVPDATIRTRLFHARREFLAAVSKNPHYRALLQDEKKNKL